MKRSVLILFIAVAWTTVAAAADTFKIDSSKSTIAKFSGTIVVDRDHPEQSSVNVAIAVASIDTGIAKRDDHLRAELFDVARYPEITFKSRRVKQTGPSSGEVQGDLTMHGVTHPITLNVELLSGRWRVKSPPLRRSQFGLVFSKSAETVSMIGDEVAIEIEIEAQRAD
jgi:polyisoprenoid-binding protein YceI